MSKETIRVLRRIVSILMFAIIIFAGYSLCSRACAATETGTVNDRMGVNMRSAPSTSAEIIVAIGYNEKVEITGEATGDGMKWYKLNYQGKSGYAAAAYITKDSTGGGSGESGGGTSGDFTNTYGVVNTKDGLNVRSGAGAGYTYLGTLNYKAQVKVNGVKKDHNGEDWYEIIYVGKPGFVKAEFMDLIEVPPYVPNQNFEQSLTEQGFPESYKVLLRQIHAQYPNWQFVAGKTGFDWDYAVNKEYRFTGGSRVNTIHNSFPDSWKSMEDGDYNFSTKVYKQYDSGNYVAASKGIIAYYMDPRNFLNSTDIFQFISTKYNSSLHTASGLQAMLNGSFMGGAFPEPSHSTYNDVIMEAARKSGVSPYTLATMILQEQGYNGRGGSISGREPGFEGLYNFFNIRAYASGNYTAVQYGLLYARDRGWTTRSKSIIEGAQWFSANYVNSGQYTQYLKKFNVMNGPDRVGTGQYMTNVSGAYQEGSALKEAYRASLNTPLVFEIPVYGNMPSEAVAKPTRTGNNNNFLDSITVGGKSVPSFNRFTYTYNVDVGNTISVNLAVKTNDPGAKVSGAGVKSLKAGVNKFNITVTATSGEKRVYTVNVKSSGAVLSSVELTSKPSKLVYSYGESALDLTGIKLTAKYSSGASENIPVTKEMVSGYDLKKLGKQTVTVTYKGKTAHFDIKVNPSDISGRKASLSYTSVEYDGTEKTPAVTVEGLRAGTDYTVAYANNIKPGSATVTISGKGNYTGTINLSFTIVRTAGLDGIFGGRDTARIYGNTRFETAVKTAEALKKHEGIDSFDAIIVADGMGYADALSGSSLANALCAPIILTGSGYEQYAADYIKSNLTPGGDVIVLGGTGAVPESFCNKLGGLNVTRLGGRDRYETNMKILEWLGATSGDLLVCTGNDFADSLSASSSGRAILLVDSKLNESQKAFLQKGSFSYHIIGGTGAVTSQVEGELASLGEVIQRIGGKNRYETSIAVAYSSFEETSDTVMLVSGSNFPDGLVGGVLGWYSDSPMILVDDGNADYARAYAKHQNLNRAIVLGGPAVVSNSAVNSIIY